MDRNLYYLRTQNFAAYTGQRARNRDAIGRSTAQRRAEARALRNIRAAFFAAIATAAAGPVGSILGWLASVVL